MILVRIAFTFLVSISASAFAEEMTLKCASDKGKSIGDTYIDLEKNVMRREWGVFTFKIVSVTEKHVTGLKVGGAGGTEVGGEVYVINRVTGDYVFSGVGLWWAMEETEMTEANANLDRYWGKGTCRTPLL